MPFDPEATTPEAPAEPDEDATTEPQPDTGEQLPPNPDNGSQDTPDTSQDGDSANENDAVHKANEEAKKYRLRSKELQAENDALTAKIDEFRQLEVMSIASEHLREPSDLLKLGEHALADFQDDAGNVDLDAVLQAVDTLLGRRPELRKPSFPKRDPNQGPCSHTRAGSDGWADVLRR